MNSTKSSLKAKGGLKKVISIPNFRNLWMAQIFSQLGDKFLIVLAVFLISEHWSDTLYASLERPQEALTILATGVYLANSIPAILFGGIAGIFADIWPKVRLMIISNSLRALIVILIPICLIKLPSISGLSWGYIVFLIIIFFTSSLTQLFTPAEQSSIPLIVSNDNLLAANSLYQSTTIGATILGFALGDPLLRSMKYMFGIVGISGGEYSLLPICYAVSTLLLTRINLKEKSNPDRERNIWLEMKSSFLIIKKIPIVRRSIIQLIILYCLMTSLYILAIGLASLIPELGPTRFGFLLSFSGIGIALGAYLLAQKGYLFNEKKLSSIGLSLVSLSLLFLGEFQGRLIPSLVFCIFLGAGASLVAIPAQTRIQKHTPPEALGKVFGLQNNLINISLSLPLLVVGGLVAQFGVLSVLWFLAAIALFGALFEKAL